MERTAFATGAATRIGRAVITGGIVFMGILGTGCSLDDLIGADQLPPDVTPPDITKTPAGAIAAYHGALIQFRDAFGGVDGFVDVTGLLTDELEHGSTAHLSTAHLVDIRSTPAGSDVGASLYSSLQRVRGQTSQAIGLLAEYAPGSEALRGRMYAIQAYAEIFLAELFCSGIPLSTLDYNGDFTYKPGSTTEEVYTHALALLGTALTLTGDSVRFAHLARVGRARALLGLGRFAEAATAVAEVPDDFRYAVSYTADNAQTERGQHFATLYNYLANPPTRSYLWFRSVGDREGINGLDFVSSGDPRTRTTATWGQDAKGRTIYHPSKYPNDGSGEIVLASGVEARLVEAEAALRSGDVTTWLNKLNHLRRTAWTMIEPPASGPLPDLTDPGSERARVDLLFRERAFWLFLTGQRQGDLRRLIRHYGRAQDEIYPTGTYYTGRATAPARYGSDVDLPVPMAEQVSNPYYTGCIRRGA